jgi:hypothetical protein
MTLKLSDEDADNKIKIRISSREHLIVDALPFSFHTDFGYQEPVNIEKDEE